MKPKKQSNLNILGPTETAFDVRLNPQVAGPLVVIFCFAIVPAALVVPLLCYKYLPMLFGAAVSTAERVVHYGRLKTNEDYRSQFEVGNMKEHPNLFHVGGVSGICGSSGSLEIVGMELKETDKDADRDVSKR